MPRPLGLPRTRTVLSGSHAPLKDPDATWYFWKIQSVSIDRRHVGYLVHTSIHARGKRGGCRSEIHSGKATSLGGAYDAFDPDHNLLRENMSYHEAAEFFASL